ncbi:MAG: RNA pseudouridine synthase [Clostridiales bacterium]|nr:RNA pseudouridine synthase [Clostridiales bacterium]
MNLNVIYEDNHIIVVEKQAGIPTQADESGALDMQSLIKQYLKEKYNKPGNVFVGIVHRLDRNVGGIMVFAKTSKGASRLSDEIRERRFHKRYIAILDGVLDKKEDILEDYLLKDEKLNKVSVVTENTRGAKYAKLDYKVLEESKTRTKVAINLYTGRAHQIRVQFASRGHALIGDTKYGNIKADKIFLWAYEIEFKHPVKDEIVKFSSLPDQKYYKI